MIRGFLPRLRSIATASTRFLLETQIARLGIMATRLWPRVRLLSVLLILLSLGCIALSGWSARSVFLTLVPTSPIGAWIAAALVALVVLELCAYTAIAGIEALLQISRDVGRHRVGVLLALATILAALGAVEVALSTGRLTPSDWIALGATAILLATTGWFQRTYRRAERRGFRDFHVDVVDARHFLARAGHGG